MLPLFLLLFDPSPVIVWSRPLQDIGVFKLQELAVVALSDAGRILLVDSDGARLLLLTAEGELIRGIGKKGDGPGEFVYPVAAGWSPRSRSFLVYDSRGQRLSWFDEEGRFLRDTKPATFIRNPIFAADRLLYALRGDTGGKGYRALIDSDPENGTVRELLRHPMQGGAILEWTPILSYAVGPHFYAANHGDEPFLQIIDREDDTRRSRLQLAVPRISLTDAYYDDRLATLTNNPKFASLGIQIEKVTNWPYVQSILIDGQDRIWLFLHREKPFQPRPYYTIDREGVALGKGTLSGNAQVFSRNDLFSIREDEEGDLYLEKMEITNAR